MKTFVLTISTVAVLAIGKFVSDRPGSAGPARYATPPFKCVNAAEFLVQKFQKHSVIALDEGPHATVQTHEFLRSLFSNRKFTETVNYVILEYLNRDYQEVVDRFIMGMPVKPEDLKQTWRQGSQAHSENFEKPVYLKLLEAIRDANAQLPVEKKMRVLAGDPTFNWINIGDKAMYDYSLSQRDIYPGQIAMAYGIKDEKKVLLIFGGEHVKKKSSDPKDSTHYTITQFLNRNYKNSTYSVGAYHGNEMPLKDCPVNSIIEPGAVTDDTFDAYYFAGLAKDWKTDTLAEKIESPYWEELNRRAMIVWGKGLDTNLHKPTHPKAEKSEVRKDN